MKTIWTLTHGYADTLRSYPTAGDAMYLRDNGHRTRLAIALVLALAGWATALCLVLSRAS